MNHFKQYLREEKVNQVDFASLVKTTQATVSRLANGHQNPTFALAKRIETATGGKVAVSNWPSFAEILSASQGQPAHGKIRSPEKVDGGAK